MWALFFFMKLHVQADILRLTTIHPEDTTDTSALKFGMNLRVSRKVKLQSSEVKFKILKYLKKQV